jgi:hypothetical protein
MAEFITVSPGSFVESFAVQSVLPALHLKGYALLPGLTPWLDTLSPLNHLEAWNALHAPDVAGILHSHRDQRKLFFLNDSGQIDDPPQLTIEFKAKAEKSHLTVIEGSERVVNHVLLPASVQIYLRLCDDFINHVRMYLREIMPATSLPTFLKLRIFDYHASDPLAGLRPVLLRTPAMRPHIDGSVFTLVISGSDGLLQIQSRGQWRPAVRSHHEPFALLLPGIAATHDFGIQPIPHFVLPGIERRVSITVFLTPYLSATREHATRQLLRWRLAGV